MRRLAPVFAIILVLGLAVCSRRVGADARDLRRSPSVTLACATTVTATVFAAVDAPGTVTSTPSIEVHEFEAGTFSDSPSAFTFASGLAVNGVWDGRVLYPPSTIRNVALSACPR